MKIVSLSLLGILFTGCNSTAVETPQHTSACKNYYAMRSAPIAPHALEDLSLKCQESNQIK
ncbi:hypothetical protein GA0116959_111112 [Acinetobacter albensis]|uniref:Entry exclusion lipoprotein TrbK n=1 Tax=Acinetobacter albensis TaxID=1673609 RepID=A0A1C4GXW7_9GAMM|nr:hypothetical protein GA0116959_111112 [Acinetobacter albensis]